MKIGIVTIFDNGNLGNRLQNYALQQSLRKFAADVVTIKNKPRFHSVLQNIRRSFPLAESVLANKLLGKGRKVRMLRFNSRHIRMTRKCYWYNEANVELKAKDRCDLYCAGSDQIWNPVIGRKDMFNYAGFTDRDRTFSYAASFGVDQIPETYKEDVRKGLQSIKHISVREDAGKRIVEELTGRTDVQVLVDPTMLLSAEEWDAVAVRPKAELPKKYLLTYFLGDVSPERRNAVVKRAEELDCEIIELMDQNSPFHEIGPGEFLYLIRHADVVCTDSFHGSVFSFLYQRPLIILDRQGDHSNMGSRLQTLASKFCMEECVAVGEDFSKVPTDPDYSAGYKALEEERKKAKAFLRMVFHEAERAGLCE